MISSLILVTSQRYNALVRDCHRLQPGEEVHMLIEGKMFVVRPAEVADLDKFPKVGP